MIATLGVAWMSLNGGVAGAEEATEPETPAQIQHVVELFTSQGCPSCRAYGAEFEELAKEPDILALGYHVDYWDYIGWRDVYGSPENTARQKAYARSFDLSTLFTPQVVIDGSRQTIAGSRDSVEAIARSLPPIETGRGASVTASLAGDNVRIEARVTPSGQSPDTLPVLIVVTFDNSTKTLVTRGENAGATLIQTNAVRDWRILGAWSGEPMKISLPLSTLTEGAQGENGCAVFIQAMSRDGRPGPILSAAKLDLSRSRLSAH